MKTTQFIVAFLLLLLSGCTNKQSITPKEYASVKTPANHKNIKQNQNIILKLDTQGHLAGIKDVIVTKTVRSLLLVKTKPFVFGTLKQGKRNEKS